MRALIHKAHDMWAAVTRRFRSPVWSVDELKRDDPAFAAHMDWMQERERTAATQRRSRNPIERAILGQRELDS